MVKKSILLVDDESSIRASLRFAFEPRYEVFEAADYGEAMKHCNAPLSLAIIDYSLPGKNGFDVLKSLRLAQPSLPAIMITAYSTEDVAILALKTGITDYLKKPLDVGYLRKRVSDLLDGERSNRIEVTIKSDKEFMMAAVTEYLEHNYKDAGLTLERAAIVAKMDRFTFSRAFKDYCGQSFIAYLNSIRLKKAVDLFRNELTMKEIAYYVGYRSVEYFSRVFKKVYGMSPGEYRKRLRDS